jgi:16S rRNA C967 or C1407 C5-methylase (RsmB/RsmF family)
VIRFAKNLPRYALEGFLLRSHCFVGLPALRSEARSVGHKMNKNDPLLDILAELLTEERLPPVDRWFSRHARERRWPATEQKRQWDRLRRALCRGFLLVGSRPEETSWPGFRVALRRQVREWAALADGARNEPSLTSAGIPDWWNEEWDERLKRSSWDTAVQTRFLRAQDEPAPVHVRFAPGKDGDAAKARLLAAGAVVPSDVPGILRMASSAGLEGGDDWNRGLIEIQDAASQLSLEGLELRPGQRVWDVCAGRGGKTLLAATELRGRGALLATDISEGKLKTIKERVRRSGWQNIRLLHWDGEVLPDFGAELRQGFDRVVVDAPCTASGTWRRDPEGRYRITPAGLRDLNLHQARLLRLGWAALKSSGRLAYVTCSWLPGENERVIEAFVAETGARPIQQRLLGLPLSDANTVYSAILEKP